MAFPDQDFELPTSTRGELCQRLASPRCDADHYLNVTILTGEHHRRRNFGNRAVDRPQTNPEIETGVVLQLDDCKRLWAAPDRASGG
jgi:hypothetical protein